MKLFSEVSPTTKTIAENLGKNSGLSSMRAHGLTTEDGKMITLSQSNIHNKTQNSVSTNEQRSHLVLRDDEEGRKKLSQLLLVCFDTLDNYGKEPEQLVNISSAFQMFLWEYSYDSVERAFMAYMKAETSMPKPADIIKLIAKPSIASVADGLTDGQQRRLEELRKENGF